MSWHFETLSEAKARVAPVSPFTLKAGLTGESSRTRPSFGVADDEISRLVQRLFLSSRPGESHKVVEFCGIDRRAGCSWVCTRAAELLALQAPGRVCVVDANLRSPSMHEYFHTDAGPGLAEAIRQREPIGHFIRSTWSDHLWLLTAGSATPAPRAVLDPARVQARFTELRDEFDFVLIDVPAISVCNDAVILAQPSDGIVLVIASNATRREAARIAKRTLEDAQVPILGAVLNKRKYPIPEAIYRRL